MRRVLFGFFIFISLISRSQSISIAHSYFNKGDYEKALLSYQNLLKRNSRNNTAILGVAKCYRQLEKNDKALAILKKGLNDSPSQLIYLLEIGVTQRAMDNKLEARSTFTNLLVKLDTTQNRSASYLGSVFKEYNLLKYAIDCFKIAMKINPNYNYNLEIGKMYGELDNLEGMFDSYLNYMLEKPAYIPTIQRYIDDFITDDPENEANQIFRKTVLKKNQVNPDILYNEMLSWLFVQQKQYRKAFLQERAIYKQTGDGINQILNIANIAKEHKSYEVAEEIYIFVIENISMQSYKIDAERSLLNIEIETQGKKQYPSIIKKYEKLIENYKLNSETVSLHLDYTYFLGYKIGDTKQAIHYLKAMTNNKLGNIVTAKIQILIGDILVLDSKFNQALIYYTRAQKKIKNHPLAQKARFKVAKTSYYKGDFNWANTQLNTLKESTTQLIANDAMDLSLLIYDNTKEQNDTVDFVLKRFAKAELLSFQEKNEKAIQIYDEIINKYQGYSIEDDALYKQAQLFILEGKEDLAIANYSKIIEYFPVSLLIDDTLFELGKLYEKRQEKGKAKEAFEKIIFNFTDSIYYVEARKHYRKLRGDAVVN